MSLSCRSRFSRDRSHLRLVVDVPADSPGIACHGAANDFPGHLESLLRRAGTQLHLEQPAASADTRSGGACHGFSLTVPERSRLHALATSNISLYPVRGLPGYLRGPSPELATVMAGIPGDVNESALLACIETVAATLEKGSTVALVEMEHWLPVLSTELPDADIVSVTAPEAMTALIHKPPALQFLPEHLAGAFAAAATGLTGTEALAFEVRGGAGAIQFGRWGGSRESVEPSSLIMALAWLLLAVGQQSVAERLHNALLTTVEDGLHTRTLPLGNPYTRVLTPGELINAVAERLDRTPRHLKRVRYGSAIRSRGRGRLNLTESR